jgi:predicted nucleotidyltransferase
MNAQALPCDLTPIIRRTNGVRLAYLFGSQVEGCVGPLSDCDVAVLIDSGIDGRRLRADLAHALAQALGTSRVDVVLLNRAPIELACAVVAHCKVLFELDVATRVEYEARVLSLYGDFLPVLRAQRAAILKGDAYDRRVQRYRAALGRTERTVGQIAAAQRQSSDRVRR